jgi:hypothetical protein
VGSETSSALVAVSASRRLSPAREGTSAHDAAGGQEQQASCQHILTGKTSGGTFRHDLFAFFVFMRFPQADARPSAVLIDEFDAGVFQCVTNGQIVR